MAASKSAASQGRPLSDWAREAFQEKLAREERGASR